MIDQGRQLGPTLIAMEKQDLHFCQEDKAKLSGQNIDPGAAFSYEWTLGCLIWSDETEGGKLELSQKGDVLLAMLWKVRGLLHSGREMTAQNSKLWLAWKNAIDDGVKWIGFSRIKIDGEARELFDRCTSGEEKPPWAKRSGWGEGLTWEDVD